MQRALNVANGSSIDYVMIVLGANCGKILENANVGRAQILFNKRFEAGISSSIKTGILNLPEDCAGCILMVADQPHLKSEHLDHMARIFKKEKRKKVVALSYNNEPRNPVLIPKSLFPKLMKLRGDSGARNIVREQKELRLVQIHDEEVFRDIDTNRSSGNSKFWRSS